MDVKQILAGNRQLMLRNIVPCEELFAALIQYGVVSDNMVNDIKTCPGREDKVARLLDLVGIKGSKAMSNFCDALQLSGHAFIADFIREEMSGMVSHGTVDTNEMIKKLPNFARVLQDQEKQQELNAFIEEKVRDSLLKQTYKKDYSDKEKAMDARQKQMEDSWRFGEIIKEKDQVVQEMREKLEEAIRDAGSKGVKLSSMSEYVQGIQQRHEKAMQGQLKYNDANSNALQRLHERQNDIDVSLKEMTVAMTKYVKGGSRRKSGSSSSSSQDKIVTELDRTKYTLKRLLSLVEELVHIQELYTRLSEEKEYIMGHLGAHQNGNMSLKSAFQDFVVSNDEVVSQLRQELESVKYELNRAKNRASKVESELNALVQDNNNVQSSRGEATAVLDSVQREKTKLQMRVDDLSKQSESRENRIVELEAETTKLRNHSNKLEQQLHKKSSKRPSTPRFQNFEEDSEGKTPRPGTDFGRTPPPPPVSPSKQYMSKRPAEPLAPVIKTKGRPVRGPDPKQSGVSFPPIRSNQQQHQASIPKRWGGGKQALNQGPILSISSVKTTSPTGKQINPFGRQESTVDGSKKHY